MGKEEKEKPEICPCCGASMKKHWHTMSPGLATVLLKFRTAVIQHKRNDLHVLRDVALETNEYNNFQKLRYFGLVAKVKTNQGDHIAGHWLLTDRGNKFCVNQERIPEKVQTFRNNIIDKGKSLIGILDVLHSSEPYWDMHYVFPYQLPMINDAEIEEEMKTDENGNGVLF